MQRSSGKETFSIWLLGDSNPSNWENVLDTPLDPRHPARHNIWTSVLDEIQDTVFRVERSRVDTRKLYIRNAIESPQQKPDGSSVIWSEYVMHEVEKFRDLLITYQPPLVFTFGAFAFEFSRRAAGKESRAYRAWTTKKLSLEFQSRLKDFRPDSVQILPLLHVSISRGQFLSSHRDFCAGEGTNYFAVTGCAIGHKLVEFQDDLPIWID